MTGLESNPYRCRARDLHPGDLVAGKGVRWDNGEWSQWRP